MSSTSISAGIKYNGLELTAGFTSSKGTYFVSSSPPKYFDNVIMLIFDIGFDMF